MINTDIDECNEGQSGCYHICSNTIGSYTCSCLDGYQLSFDNQTCSDINECNINNGGCRERCHNTDGSYYCACYIGYMLAEGHDHNCIG